MNIGRSPQAQLLPIVKDLQGLGRICGQRYYGPLLDHIKGPFQRIMCHFKLATDHNFGQLNCVLAYALINIIFQTCMDCVRVFLMLGCQCLWICLIAVLAYQTQCLYFLNFHYQHLLQFFSQKAKFVDLPTAT